MSFCSEWNIIQTRIEVLNRHVAWGPFEGADENDGATAISSAMSMWHQWTREGERKKEKGRAKNRKGKSERRYERRRITRGEGREGLRYSRLSGSRRVRWAEVPGAPLITLTYDPINHRQIIHHLSRRGTKAGARSLVTARAHIFASTSIFPVARFFRTPTISLDRENECLRRLSTGRLIFFY